MIGDSISVLYLFSQPHVKYGKIFHEPKAISLADE